MRDLDLTSLRLFVTVCDTGNMSRAAEKANMVASAVSKRLAQLEATVGASLLTRRKHGVVPTPAALALWPAVREALSLLRHSLAPGGFDPAGATARVTAPGEDQTVDVVSSYRLTRNIDVTAGVRYSSSDRDRLLPLTDGRQDNQAVYVGTQFRF